MVLVKKASFFRRLCLGDIGQENVFYDILERKNVFLGYENEEFRKSKIEIFPKGLVHGFGEKGVIFPSFVFRRYSTGKCVL